MPIFNVRAPDGSLMKISGPEDATDEELIHIAEQNYKPKQEYSIGQRAKAALSSGIEQLPESAAGIGLGLKSAIGMNESAGKQAEAIRAENQKVKEGPTPITFQELEDTYGKEGAIAALKKLPSYMVEQILQSAPSMAVPLGVAAGAGALSGPLAPIVAPVAGIGTYGLQQFGNFMQRQAQEGATGETLAPGKAAAAAAITAPIGFYADKLTLGLGAIPEKILGKEVAAELARRTGGVAARGAVGATTGVVAEAPTEVLEQIAERWQAGLPLNDEKAHQEYKEAFMGAAAVGGLGGAGAHILAGRPQEPAAAPAATAEQAPEQPKEPTLALGAEKPFTPVSLPDGSVALTQADLDAYEKSQFEKKYAPQPADKLALGLSEPFSPVSLPDGSVALTRADLDAYEQEQFEKKYAPQPNLNTVEPAATPPQLGYSPLPGVPKIAPNGTVLLTPEQEFQNRYAPQKTRITTEAWQAMSPEEQHKTWLDAQMATAPESIPEASPAKLSKEQQKPIFSPEEIADVKDAREALKDVNAQIEKAKSEGTDLFNRLKGVLPADEVHNILPEKKKGRIGTLASKAAGTPLSSLVADGSLNEFLPPDMRITAPGQDEMPGVEYITQAIQNGDTKSFDSKTALQALEKAKEEIKSRIEQPKAEREANLNLGAAAEEQAGVEGISTDDLFAYAKNLGIDTEGVAQDVARQTQGMTNEQYQGALRNALISEVNSRSPETQTLAAVGSKQKGFTATKEELKMQKDLLGKDMIQAAQYAIKNAPNAFYKFVGNKVLQKLKKMQDAGIKLSFTVENGNTRDGRLYRANGFSSFVMSRDGRPSAFNLKLNGAPVMENQNGYPSGMNYTTLMHELLHVATQAEIKFLNYTDANHPAVGELIRLYNKVAEEFKAQEKAGTLPDFLVEFRKGSNNALASVDEMLTWSMTDERMQKWMSDIKVGDKTLFSKIIDLIRSVMGIAKPFETALDRLVRTTEQIIDIDTQVTADGMTKRGYYYGPKEGVKRMPKEQQSLFSRAAQAMMEEDTKSLIGGKKEEAPTPVGAGIKSMQILEAMGRGNQEAEPGYGAKIRQAWDNARDNPKATAEAAKAATTSWLDKVETWAFSSDAALNNRIRREIEASTMANENKIGMLLNASLSQTVHSDAVASLFLQKGGIKYNEELHKWEGVSNDSNFVKLSKQLDSLAEKNGLTKQQAELVAHTAFEAKRLRSLVQFNSELADKIAEVKKEAAAKRNSSPVAASALSKEAARMQGQFKFISEDQLAMIEPGMELFKVHPELNDVVKTWNEIRTNAVKTLVDTGLWSENEAEEMLGNADYVPFYREDQLENNQGPKEFMRGLQVQAKEKRLKGSSRPVNDIFDNQVRWVQYSINRAVRNRSALALADTAVEVGAAKKVDSRQSGENVVRVWRNGQEEFYSMDDPMFMDAFNGLEAIVIPSWKWASNLANMLRQSVVMYPMFSIAQVPQDSFAAMFSSGLKPQYALRIPVLAVKEFIQTWRGKSKTHEELKNVGAVGVRDFTSAMVRMDAEIYAGLKAPPGVLGKIKHSLNHIAMSADNAVRQAVYEASMAQGLSRAEAMEKAFDVFNVRRKGSSKSLALAGQLIPFFSAYLAAQNVAYKTITGRGISPTERQDAYKSLFATTASVMTLSLLYAMMNGDDDDYLKKPATQRDRLLMVPGTGGFSIPLRADLFTLPKIITEHMYLMMTDKGYEDGRKFRDSMKAALGSALLGPTAVPQAIKPFVEVGINYDFFQGRPLIGTYQQKLETERQFTDSTSELGKILGKTGLVSPIAADHLIRGMLGSAGGLIIYATNPILHSDPNTPRPSLSERDAIAALPGMSGFMLKSYESALKKDFYTLKEEVDKAANTLNDLKTRSPQDIEGFLSNEENLSRIGLQKSVNKIGEDLSKIRKSIAQITNSSMPADQKQQQIEMLRKVEEEMLKGVNVKMLRELGKI